MSGSAKFFEIVVNAVTFDRLLGIGAYWAETTYLGWETTMAHRMGKESIVKQRRALAARQKFRVMQIQGLEKREVPAIALAGAELTVTAGDFNDAVVISTQVVNGQSMVTARRTETRVTPIGNVVFQEADSFLASRVAKIRVTLGNGTNSFTNNTALPSLVTGGTGNDLMQGGSGKDIFSGLSGHDRLFGRNGADTLVGGDGVDTIEGGDGDDILFGGPQNDTLRGGLGNDRIQGDDGNDTIEGGLGVDTIWGGAGDDKIAGDVHGSAGLLDSENTISGGDGDDIIYGGGKVDTLSGNAGNDEIYGQDGADVLRGDGDRDRIYGGNGNDQLLGGAGDDWLDGDDGDDEVRGGDGADRLHGDEGADKLYGELGRDILIGGDGVDMMVGGEDVDTLVGIDGLADIIFAGTTATTTVRDELWLDPQDALVNTFSVASVKAIDPDAVHLIQGYRKYWVGGLQLSTPIQLGVPLIDPSARQEDSGLLNDERPELPLFSSAGPQFTDIDQGNVGSCYFLARLASLAKTHPQYIRDMVVDLGDGTYVVQFYFQSGAKTYVRVDNSLYRRSGSTEPYYTNLGAEGSMWGAIIEKAWAIHRYGTASYDDISGGNSEQTNTSVALGLNQVDTFTRNLTSAMEFVNLIRDALNNGRTVLVPAPGNLSDFTPMTLENRSRGSHVYMVHSVETNAQGVPTKVLLYNLYGEPLIEITNFAMFFWCATKAAVAWPK